MSVLPPTSWLHYLAVGARLTALESILAYFLPLVFLFLAPSPFPELFWRNLTAQLCVFIPLVQIPAFLKTRMSYVDIGWPVGLVALGIFGAGLEKWRNWVEILVGSGAAPGAFLDLISDDRAFLMSAILVLHGGRMALGAITMFYPYVFAQDLPRYRFAKLRWEVIHKMPAAHWWLKIQHDTLQQCFANAAVLACPLFLVLARTEQDMG